MLADNLRYLRLKNGYSQEFVAKYLGKKSFTTVQKWETGSSDPPLEVFGKLAELYKVSMDDLYNTDLQKPQAMNFDEDVSELSDFEKELIRMSRALPESIQNEIKDYVEFKFQKYMQEIDKGKEFL